MNKKFLVVILFSLFPLAARAQRLQAEANLGSLMCLGTLAAQIEYAPLRNWSFGFGGKYNPFTFNESDRAAQFQLRQRAVDVMARYWPWHVYSGWWIAAKAQWQEYNFGGLISSETEEGMKIGGGLSAGFALMMTSHLNLDFGLGVWGGVKRYTKYSCPRCGQRLSEGSSAFFLPNDVIIAVSYVF